MSRRRRDLAAVVGFCAIALALGAAGKACRGFWREPASFVCHSDIRALYPLRGMDRELFPYLHGELVVREDPGPPRRYSLRPVDGANEYPVLTGVLMWLPSTVADGPDTYLLASILLLAPFGLATAWALGRLSPERALRWSASPILVLYAFHNWDLPVVAASIAGIWSWWRGRPEAAAACFGIGGALKVYPLLFLAPLVLDRIHDGDRGGAVRAGAAGLATLGLVNLPILLLSPTGWAVPYRFQGLRPPNDDSLWGELTQRLPLDQDAITAWSTIAVVAVMAALTAGSVRRAGRDGTYPFLPACAALLAGFLLVGKVHSPQFALWLLPFFALLEIRTAWYVLFVVGNLVMYAAIFGVSVWSVPARDALVTASVWARAATFLLLVIVFLRSRPAAGAGRGPVGSPQQPAVAD